ncbi:MAG: DNA methyltransferase [Chloroflexi bacterium]|nr:DNA methyltransferase [Chloroflexota bacterium]
MNFASQTVWTADCLDIMRGMNSECIDLICLDPPFNSNANYAAPIGSQAAGAEFKDTWTMSDIDSEWINLIQSKHPALYRVLLAALTDSDKSYLVYMAVRLLEMRRILKSTGSIFLHCDPTMSHYLKLVLDAIFGRSGFRNEIVWKRTNAPTASPYKLGSVHDTIFLYAMSNDTRLRPVFIPFSAEYIKRHFRYNDERGLYQASPLTAKGVRSGYSGGIWRGVDVSAKGLHWSCPTAFPDPLNMPEDWGDMNTLVKLDWLDEHNMIHWPKRGITPRFKRYLSTSKGARLSDNITDVPGVQGASKENQGYPTQKPLALYKRFIEAGSDEGDVVLDPFCGCATTCIAAQDLGRQWAGIDVAGKAIELTQKRLRNELGLFANPIHRRDIPKRTDLGALLRPAAHKKALYGEQAGHCEGCDHHFQIQHLEVDHIIPRSKGGTDHIENLQLLCGSCNRIEGNRGMEYLRVKLQLN